MKRQTILAGLVLSCSACLQLLSQTSQTSVTMPKSPGDYLRQAVHLNGLAAEGLQPWHVKATYKQYDDAGMVSDTGTIEEWRLTPGKYKVVLIGKRYAQIQYWDGNRLLVTGDQNPPSWTLKAVQKYIDHPLPIERFLEHEQIQRSEIKFGQIQLECLHAAPAGMPGNAFWCFSKESPAVRLTADTDGSRTIFNTVSNVSGQWIAKQVSWIKDSKPRLEMTVDTLDYPAHIQEGNVQATPDATVPEKIVVGDELPQPKKIHNQAPEYPINAKAEHIEGAVRISATIERDGSVDELNVISGPKELQQPALNAIKQWRYEPYLLDGKPVMVQTQITVFFTLGRR